MAAEEDNMETEVETFVTEDEDMLTESQVMAILIANFANDDEDSTDDEDIKELIAELKSMDAIAKKYAAEEENMAIDVVKFETEDQENTTEDEELAAELEDMAAEAEKFASEDEKMDIGVAKFETEAEGNATEAEGNAAEDETRACDSRSAENCDDVVDEPLEEKLNIIWVTIPKPWPAKLSQETLAEAKSFESEDSFFRVCVQPFGRREIMWVSPEYIFSYKDLKSRFTVGRKSKEFRRIVKQVDELIRKIRLKILPGTVSV